MKSTARIVLILCAALVSCKEEKASTQPQSNPSKEDAVESKKKRLAELFKQGAALVKQAEQDPAHAAELKEQGQKLMEQAKDIVKDLGDENSPQVRAFVEDALKKYSPDLASRLQRIDEVRIHAHEAGTRANLKTLVTAEAMFQMNDSGMFGRMDFWVADVSGLHRLKTKSGPSIGLIEANVALADAQPCVALDAEGSFGKGDEARAFAKLDKGAPRMGYYYIALAQYESEPGKWAKYDDGTGRNSFRYGFCAYPAEYGKSGKLTFIVGEDACIWMKDTQGKPPEGHPLDPKSAGWEAP